MGYALVFFLFLVFNHSSSPFFFLFSLRDLFHIRPQWILFPLFFFFSSSTYSVVMDATAAKTASSQSFRSWIGWRGREGRERERAGDKEWCTERKGKKHR